MQLTTEAPSIHEAKADRTEIVLTEDFTADLLTDETYRQQISRSI